MKLRPQPATHSIVGYRSGELSDLGMSTVKASIEAPVDNRSSPLALGEGEFGAGQPSDDQVSAVSRPKVVRAGQQVGQCQIDGVGVTPDGPIPEIAQPRLHRPLGVSRHRRPDEPSGIIRQAGIAIGGPPVLIRGPRGEEEVVEPFTNLVVGSIGLTSISDVSAHELRA